MADVEKINGYDIKDASAVHSVTVTQNLTSGTKVGSVSVDGSSTDLYAPTNTNTWRPVQVNGTAIGSSDTLNLKAGSNVSLSNSSGTVTIAATDTTYSSKAAASGGTDVSLVTTGEKYTWNNKSNLALGTTSTTAAAGNHTHTTSLAAGGTSTVDLAANTAYTLTAGGTSVVFKTPPDNNSVTGVKGNAESSYRTGNVNLTAANVGAAASDHTHATSIAASSGTNQITLAASTKYAITAGGTSYVFTTPPDTNTNTWRPVQVNGTAIGSSDTLNLKAGSNVSLSNSSGTVTIAATDTTYSSKTAASGGTDVSLCTTGEKYTWNNKSNLAIGTTATTAAAGNHTHATSIATSTGTNQLTLAASTKYAITAGGTSYVFTTPPNTTYSSKTAASGGTDVSLCTTGEKYTWNNKSNLAIGTTSTTAAAGNHTHTTSIAASSGTNQLTMAAGTKYAITAGGTSYVFTTPSNAITGVKGNSESSYRTGNVNLTAANIGAAASSHNHAASNITSGQLGVAYGGTGNTTGRAASVTYVTSAPSANNTDGVKIAVLSSEPSTKYTGWLYIITG